MYKRNQMFTVSISSVLEFIYRKQKTSRIEIANATVPDSRVDDRDYRETLKARI